MKHKECDYKKVFFFIIVGLFLTSMMVGVVSAQTQDGVIKTLWDAFFGGINFQGESNGGFLENNFDNDWRNLVAFVLVIFLVVMLVYSVLDFVPIFDKVVGGKKIKSPLQTLTAIVIGILAFLFFDPKAIRELLVTYEALGVALTSIIPLMVIIFFSFNLSQDGDLKKIIFSRLVEVIFFIYLFFKVILVIRNDGLNLESPVLLTYGISAIVLIFWMVWISKAIREWYSKKYLEELSKNATENIQKAAKQILDLGNMRDGTASSPPSNG
jgi:hypothetical protein